MYRNREQVATLLKNVVPKKYFPEMGRLLEYRYDRTLQKYWGSWSYAKISKMTYPELVKTYQRIKLVEFWTMAESLSNKYSSM